MALWGMCMFNRNAVLVAAIHQLTGEVSELRRGIENQSAQIVFLTKEVKRMSQAEIDLQNADASLAAAVTANTAENSRNANVINDGLNAIKQLLTNAGNAPPGTPDADLVVLTQKVNDQVAALQASTAALKTNNDTLEAAAQAVLTPAAPAAPDAPAAPAA